MLIKDEAHSWMIATLTAAHYDLPEAAGLMTEIPPGGVAALVSMALVGLEAAGVADGLTPDQCLLSFALLGHEMS